MTRWAYLLSDGSGKMPEDVADLDGELYLQPDNSTDGVGGEEYII